VDEGLETVMGKVLLNGREPLDWELAALERARQCELERDTQVLAGLLTGAAPEPGVSRPVTDILWEFS
jgi:hypothetical protein